LQPCGGLRKGIIHYPTKPRVAMVRKKKKKNPDYVQVRHAEAEACLVPSSRQRSERARALGCAVLRLPNLSGPKKKGERKTRGLGLAAFHGLILQMKRGKTRPVIAPLG